MIQISAQIRILVAVEAIDGRKGIDAIAQLCREKLSADPFSGYLFVFRTRRGSELAFSGRHYRAWQKRPHQQTERPPGAARRIDVVMLGRGGLGLITSSNFFVPQVNLPGSMVGGNSCSGVDARCRQWTGWPRADV
jgi:hypothetical protein